MEALLNKNTKPPDGGVPQVSEEGTPSGSVLRGGSMPDPKTHATGPQESVPGGSGNADPLETKALAEVSCKIKDLQISKRKQSRSQRKKLAKLKASEDGREWFPKNVWRERRKALLSSNIVQQTEVQSVAPLVPSAGAGERREVGVVKTPSPKAPQTPRSEISTPSTGSEKTAARGSKRVRYPDKELTGSFRDALSAARMAVVLDSYPNDLLGKEQADLLKQKLAEQICKNPGGIRPQFRGCFLSRGALIVNCDNERSRLWLERTIPELQVGEGARLRVGLARSVTRVAKVAMWVSGAHKDASPPAVLESLNVQNEGLETADWRLINRKVEPKGQTLVFDLSEQSLGRLKRSNFKLFLGLDVVKLRVVSKPIGGAADNDPPKLLEAAAGEPQP
uniref:DUF4780 domain-containing protein n=1 Tax=Rhodnius prolixus TaxID=13249 RepID=T1IBV4_RHOPR